MALLFRLAVFSFLVLLPITSAAQTAGDLYFGVRGGAVILNDAELSDTTGTLQALGAELEMKTGFGVAGAIGYDWRSPPNYATDFRAEFEVSYRYNDADSVTVPGFGTISLDGGYLSTWAGMGNIYFDIHTPSSVYPYIGAGVGLANVSDGDVDDTAFAYQGMVGLAYRIRSGTKLNLEYRYMAVPDVELPITGTAVSLSADYQSHNVFVGIAIDF